MKKLAIGFFATTLAIGAGSAALAAAPGQFRAHGSFHSVSDGDAQNVNLVISFKTGHVRIESDSKDAGKSVILATKGKDDIAMLDPAQKVVVHMKPSMLKQAGGADSADITSYQSLLDPTGMKAFILKRGHKVGVGPAILGHSTTIYEANRKGDSMRVWLANDVSLPLKIEGHGKGSTFTVNITSLDLHPSFGAHDFDELPPGYQDIRAESSK